MIRPVFAALLVTTGLVHLWLFGWVADGPARIPVGVFGLIYLGAGIAAVLARTARWPVWLGMGGCGLGFALGVAGAVTMGLSARGAVLLAVDLALVAAGAFMLFGRPAAR